MPIIRAPGFEAVDKLLIRSGILSQQHLFARNNYMEMEGDGYTTPRDRMNKFHVRLRAANLCRWRHSVERLHLVCSKRRRCDCRRTGG